MNKVLGILLRFAIMIPACLSVLWPLLNGAGLFMAIIGSWVAILLAEWKLLQKLKTRTIILGSAFSILLILFIADKIISWIIIPSIFGPTGALFLRSLLMGGGASFSLILGFRLLAKRSGFWFTVELGLLALSSVVVFFPHQYKIIMRPLWLSDLAWSTGLEPSLALGVIGAILATFLSVQTVLDRSRRIHPSIILFPIMALLALILVNPLEMETPPPPQRLEDIKGGGSMSEKGEREQNGGGSGGQADQNDQGMNSGNQEKQNGGEGQQPRPVAIMLLGNDYTPPSEYFYLRQEVQSSFNGIRLIAPTSSDIEYDAFRGFPSEVKTLSTPPLDYRLEVLTDIALLTDHTTPFGIESPVSYQPTTNPRPGRFARTYQMTSQALNVGFEQFLKLDLHIGNSEWSEEEWKHYTSVPENEQYKELAESIIEGLPPQFQDNQIAQAFAVKLFLDEKTQYTMSERHEKAEDPTAEFLFGPDKQFIGYCVHTSHAAAFLWRALGIPARIGVGYAVTMEQQKGGAVLVMDRDAHSWPEVYIEELGWVVMDIAPETMLDPMGEPPDLEMLDALEELARAAPDSQFRKPIDWKALWWAWKPTIIGTIISIIAAIFIGLCVRKIRRRVKIYISPSPYWLYLSALDRLGENGEIRRYGESREAFAKRLGEEYPSFQEITWIQLESVLGEELSISSEKLQQLVKHLSSEIREKKPFWRRILGLLNPFSPFLSK